MEHVRVRFAPSPTGFLHIGGLRTALYNFLFARRHHGAFILRIEDTDVKRTVPGGAENIIRTLQAFGLDPDEGPIYQSERLDQYRRAAEDLVSRGKAYQCYCTSEELDEQRRRQSAAHQPTVYDRRCRHRESKPSQSPYVIRFAAPEDEGSTAFDDIIHRRIEVPNTMIDDAVLLKSDGFPTYHLASVVDDHAEGITHVIRGDEWIPSTPKHVLLYRAFGWEAPMFAHLPLLLNPDRSKLSKRQQDVSVEDYLVRGYLPEALLNFVALLGWNPTSDREIFTRDELVPLFDLARVNKGGAVVNAEKLDWMNSRYLRALSDEELVSRAMPFLQRAGLDTDRLSRAKLRSVVSLERERIQRLDQLPEAVSFIFTLPEYDPALLVWKRSNEEETRRHLSILTDHLRAYTGPWEPQALEDDLKRLIETRSLGTGETLWPLRVALSGRAASPGPFEIASLLGPDETRRRIEYAQQKAS